MEAQWLGGPQDGAWVPLPDGVTSLDAFHTVEGSEAVAVVRVPVLPHRDGTHRIVWAARTTTRLAR
jgi:hypothetical protein